MGVVWVGVTVMSECLVWWVLVWWWWLMEMWSRVVVMVVDGWWMGGGWVVGGWFEFGSKRTEIAFFPFFLFPFHFSFFY